jgi:hypothetical protein
MAPPTDASVYASSDTSRCRPQDPAQGCPNRQVRIPSRDRILCPDNARDSGVIGFLKERLIMGSSLSCRHRPVSLFRLGEYNLAV